MNFFNFERDDQTFGFISASLKAWTASKMTSQISHAFWHRQHTNNSVKQHDHDILNILKKHNQNYAKICYLIKKIGIRTGTCFFKFISFKLFQSCQNGQGSVFKITNWCCAVKGNILEKTWRFWGDFLAVGGGLPRTNCYLKDLPDFVSMKDRKTLHPKNDTCKAKTERRYPKKWKIHLYRTESRQWGWMHTTYTWSSSKGHKGTMCFWNLQGQVLKDLKKI